MSLCDMSSAGNAFIHKRWRAERLLLKVVTTFVISDFIHLCSLLAKWLPNDG